MEEENPRWFSSFFFMSFLLFAMFQHILYRWCIISDESHVSVVFHRNTVLCHHNYTRLSTSMHLDSASTRIEDAMEFVDL
jgi:hypothetical protein